MMAKQGQKQQQARALWQAGTRPTDIARQVGVTQSAVSQWIAKWRRDAPQATATGQAETVTTPTPPATETRTPATTQLNPPLTAEEMTQPTQEQERMIITRQAAEIEQLHAEIGKLEATPAHADTPPPEPPSLDAQVNELVRTYFSALPAEEGMQEKIRKSIMDEVVSQHNKQARAIVQNVYQQIFALGSAAYTTYWPRAQALGKTDLYSWINEALSFWAEWSADIDGLKAQLTAYREMRAYVAMAFASHADLHPSAIAYFMLPEHFQES